MTEFELATTAFQNATIEFQNATLEFQKWGVEFQKWGVAAQWVVGLLQVALIAYGLRLMERGGARRAARGALRASARRDDDRPRQRKGRIPEAA